MSTAINYTFCGIGNGPFVQEHLQHMKQTFDYVQHMSSLDLYIYLRALEEAYVLDHKNTHNFCSLVHKMNPVKFNEDWFGEKHNKFKWTITSVLKCFHCENPMHDQQAYDVHILGQASVCVTCGQPITFEMIAVRTTQLKYNLERNSVLGPDVMAINVEFPIQVDFVDTWQEFAVLLKRDAGVFYKKQHRDVIYEMVRRFHDNISSVGLDLVKGMYRQLDFVYKVCSNFAYWMDVDILGQAIHRYNLFMHLNCDHEKTLYPTTDIAIVWHAHMINLSQTYLKDTQRLCGRQIDHDDTLDGEDPHKAYARTFIWWNEKYSSPYSAARPDFWQWQQNHNLKSALFPPYGVFRLLKWSVLSAGKTDGHSSFNEKTGQRNAVVGTPVFDEEVRPMTELDSPLFETLRAIASKKEPRVELDLTVVEGEQWEAVEPIGDHHQDEEEGRLNEEEVALVLEEELSDPSAPRVVSAQVVRVTEDGGGGAGEGKEAESEGDSTSGGGGAKFENA
jgi:hypothetical protein